MTEFDVPFAGRSKTVAYPVQINQRRPPMRHAPPRLGEHTEEVQAEWLPRPAAAKTSAVSCRVRLTPRIRARFASRSTMSKMPMRSLPSWLHSSMRRCSRPATMRRVPSCCKARARVSAPDSALPISTPSAMRRLPHASRQSRPSSSVFAAHPRSRSQSWAESQWEPVQIRRCMRLPHRDGARTLGVPGIALRRHLGTRHLAGLIGGQRARETLVEGKILDAGAAHACGLLSELCEPDRLDARVEELLARSTDFDPETLRTLLRLTRQSSSASDMEELMRSTARKGLAERMRAHTRKVLPAKAKER